MTEDLQIIADPFNLLANPDAIGTVPEVAAKLQISRIAVRGIIDEKWREVRYVDRRAPGVPFIKTRSYALADIAAHVPAYLAWRERERAKGLEKDARKTTEARAAKALKPAKVAKGKPPSKMPTPKPSAPPPRPALPPLLVRRRGPEVIVMRRASR